mgnify:CR=1 FL=1
MSEFHIYAYTETNHLLNNTVEKYTTFPQWPESSMFNDGVCQVRLLASRLAVAI